MNFLFNIPSKVIFEVGASNKIDEILLENQTNKVLCIYDQGIKNTGIVDRLTQRITNAGIHCFEFGDVQPDPTIALVDSVAMFARENDVDTVVAIGGGSSMDVAKCVNVLLENPGSVLDYTADANLVENRGRFLVLIPTTFGTASEVTEGAVITNAATKQKVCMWGKNCGGDIALIDPELSLSVPSYVTAATGMDALSHSVESYTSTLSTPITDALSLEAIKLIGKNLPLAVADGSNLEARTNLCLGSLMAGLAFNNSLLNQGHGLAHPIGAHGKIPHGIACAISLPFAVQLNAAVMPEKTRAIGNALGMTIPMDITAAELGKLVSNHLLEFGAKINIPNLKSMNVERTVLPLIADAFQHEPDQFTYPYIPTTQEVLEYLEEVYQY